MEKSSSKANQSSIPFFTFVEFFLFNEIFRWVSSAQNFFLKFRSHNQSQLVFEKEYQNFKLLNLKNPSENKIQDDELSREDVEMVMTSLELFCNPETEKLQEKFNFEELSGLFEEKEPSLEELNEAFVVFDQNRDGFIDAMELQRVLCILGFKEGSSLENCTQMIKSFDENKDGRIDFHEFVKFMENGIC